MSHVKFGLYGPAGVHAVLRRAAAALLLPGHYALFHLLGGAPHLLSHDLVKVDAAVGVGHRDAQPHQLAHLGVCQHLLQVELRVLGFQLLGLPVPLGVDLPDLRLPLGCFALLLGKLFGCTQPLILAFQLVHLPGRLHAHALLHGQLLVIGVVLHPAAAHRLGQGRQVVGVHAVGFVQGAHQVLHRRAAFQQVGSAFHGPLHQLLGLFPVFALQQRMERRLPFLRRPGIGLFLLLALRRILPVLRARIARVHVALIAKGSHFEGAGGLGRLRGRACRSVSPLQRPAPPCQPLLRRAELRLFHSRRGRIALAACVAVTRTVTALGKQLQVHHFGLSILAFVLKTDVRRVAFRQQAQAGLGKFQRGQVSLVNAARQLHRDARPGGFAVGAALGFLAVCQHIHQRLHQHGCRCTHDVLSRRGIARMAVHFQPAYPCPRGQVKFYVLRMDHNLSPSSSVRVVHVHGPPCRLGGEAVVCPAHSSAQAVGAGLGSGLSAAVAARAACRLGRSARHSAHVGAVLLVDDGRQLLQLLHGLLQLGVEGAVLLHPLAYLLDAVKVHHIQRRQRSVRVGRCKKAQLVALFRRLVLGKAAEGALLGRAYQNVKHGLVGSQLHAAHALGRLGPQRLAGKLHVFRPAGLPRDAVYPALVVKLPHQLDHKVAFLCKGPVGAFQHIAAELRARLLQRCNGRSRRQAAGGAALAHVPVAADLLQLGHPVVPVADAVAGESAGLQWPEGLFRQPPHHVHDVPAGVRQFLLVHPRRVAQHIAAFGCQPDVLIHGVVHLVDGGLGVLHHVDVPKPRRAVFFRKQRVKHKGVFAVVVKAPVGKLRVVLAGVQNHPVAKLAVVQHRLSACPSLFVVPVHHHALGGSVDVLIVDVLGHVQAAARVPFQLGPLGRQLVVVRQCQAEQARAVLDVGHPRLPIQVQKVHALDGNVSKSAPQRRVPEHALHPGTLLELAPPGVAVHLLVVGLFQHHGQHLGEHPGRLLIVRRSRQHVGLRVVVHSVGVLVGDGVEQPPAGGRGLAFHLLIFVILPMLHAEPQLVVDDPRIQRRLAALVSLQDLRCLGHLFGANGLQLLPCIFPFQRRFSLLSLIPGSPLGGAPQRAAVRRTEAVRGLNSIKLGFPAQFQRVVPQRFGLFGLPGAEGIFHQHIPALVVNVVFLSGVDVFHVALAVHQVRDGADEVFAGGKHLKHGPPILSKGKTVVELHLPSKPRVVTGGPVQKVRGLFLHLGNALTLTLVEDGRVGHPQNHPPFQQRVVLLCLSDAPCLLHRVDFQALVGRPGAAVQLLDAVQPSFFVRCVPPHGKRLRVAEIVPPPDLPVPRDAEGLYHVGPPLVVVVGRVVPPFGEHLAGKAVPVAVKQRLLFGFRQAGQRADVARVVLQQGGVVKNGAGDKNAGAPPG
nr:MAG TPA_asm: hypothetical protein [Caudoviricetes sp.]